LRTFRGAIIGAVILAMAFVPSAGALGQSTPSTAAADFNTGTYYSLQPARILDTRTGNGAPQAKLGQGATISLQVTGRGGVPATGVAAVVLNVTVTNATAASFLTVYPSGVSRPTASSLNFVAGWTGANSVTVAVGTGGKVNVYNNGGSTDVIADVFGFYASDASVVGQLGPGGRYLPVAPDRLFDSRVHFGDKVQGGSSVGLGISFGPDINPHIRALVVNVTAVDANGPGFLTTWNGVAGQRPGTSTLNYVQGATVPNMAVVPTALCCGGILSIGVYAQTTTHVIVDLLGVFDDGTIGGGLLFAARTPVRIADSRIGQGTPHALGPATTATITTPGSIATPDTVALALNVTAVSPTALTFMTVWPSGIPGVGMPGSSNLNPAPGQTVPNAVYTLIGPTAGFNVYNNAGTVHLVVDVVGTFYDPTIITGGSASAQDVTRPGRTPLKRTGTQPAATLDRTGS
jgi:hypothetical protein